MSVRKCKFSGIFSDSGDVGSGEIQRMAFNMRRDIRWRPLGPAITVRTSARFLSPCAVFVDASFGVGGAIGTQRRLGQHDRQGDGQ